ncbi:MAG: Ig-like domain-containing domain [Bacteroidales bacterium]
MIRGKRYSIEYVRKFDVSLQVVERKTNISATLSLTALVMLLALSCAKISAPTGGPKDNDPPVILKSLPGNSTVMFTGKEFEITFDEYVVLDRITEKFMVSPPLAKKPEIKLKGKTLAVTWEDDLADSTTYTFYFQDAIRDNNENNPIPNYQYVFSTGPVLDSLSLTGNVFNAADLEIVEDVMVMMYSNLSDTAPRTVLPAYISRPDPSGGFMINNIRPGSYRLFALKDLNGNSLYDLDDEIFAFGDSVISITPEEYFGLVPDTVSYKPPNATETTKPDKFVYGQHRIYAFQQQVRKQYLKFTERKSAWSIGFGLAAPSDSGQLSVKLADADSSSWFIEHNAVRDTFMLWITDPEVYGLDIVEAMLTYPFTDSTGTVIPRTDTVSFRYLKPPAPRGGPGRVPGLSLITNVAGKIRPGTVPFFRSATPLADPDTSLIAFTRTVDSLQVKVPFQFVRDTATSRRFTMKASLDPGASYSLLFNKGAFRDIYGLANDSVMYRIQVATPEDYGSLSVSLTGYEGDVIIQVVAEKDRLIQETYVRSPGLVSFPLLDKGRYRLKAIYDIDGNRVWTTGDYNAGRQPEPVTYYSSELEVKINWALEQDWDIGEVYVKDVSLRNKPAVKR